MNSFLSAVANYTAFDPASEQSPPGNQGFQWLPVVGLMIGLMSAGLYYPLATVFIPGDVALLLALCWQAFIGNFLSERHHVKLWRNQDAGRVSLVFGLLLKFTIFRQFYPEQIWLLFIISSLTVYCGAAITYHGADSHMATKSIAIALWILGLTVFILPGNPLQLSGNLTGGVLVTIILVSGIFAFVMIYTTRYVQRYRDGVVGNLVFFPSFIADLTICTTLLLLRNL